MYETTRRFVVTKARVVTEPTAFMEKSGVDPELIFPYTRLQLNGIPENEDDWMTPLSSIHWNTPADCGLKVDDKVEVQELIDKRGSFRYYWNTAACRACTQNCDLGNPPKANENIIPFDPGCAGDP